MTIGEALRHGAAVLGAAGVDTPALDARLLLGHAMGRDQAGLLRDRDVPADMAAFWPLLDRRAGREPLALITGRQGFWTFDVAVSADTLIPRADSEAVIEAAIAERRQVRSVLDLGTGTGCLLLAALAEFPDACGIGADRSAGAAALARANARALGLAGRAMFVVADWAAPLCGRFDLVLSNPPYIDSASIAGLMPEVARFEPRGALDGGVDGLDAYRALLAALPGLLAPGGLAVFELGAGQAEAVSALASGFRSRTRADLFGTPRAMLLERLTA